MSVALIAEGVTDHVILSNLLHGYFNDPDIEINELHPKDRESPYGWTKVFEYISTDEFKGAFEWNDYIVIHIDTDTKQDWNYDDIPEVANNDNESVFKQIECVKGIFIDIIGKEFYEENKTKILFAIAVQSIECWLLPFYSNNEAHSGKIINCLNTLNRQYLDPEEGFTIDPNKKGYDNNRYFEKAAKPLKKFRELKSKKDKNPSLSSFLNDLDERFNKF